MYKKIKKMLALTLCCVMFVGFEAQASETLVLTREMREELKDNLEELGVPYDVQEALISKLQSGEVWDSMKEENIEKFYAMEFHFTPETPIKRMVFDDGSVLQQEIEFKDSDVQSKNARSAMRTTFTDVKIGVKNGLSGGGFYATYVIDWNAHHDGIISVKEPFCNVLCGDYSELSVRIDNAFEVYSKKQPAEATYSVHISYAQGLAAETLYIKMYVGNDKMVSGKLGSVNKITY